MLRLLAVLAALVALASFARVLDPRAEQTLTMTFVAQLEQGIDLPERAYSLDEYARYYRDVTIKGHRKVQAVYIIPWPEKGMVAGSVTIVTDGHLPGQDDGGCSLIFLEWDFYSGDLVGRACNGRA